MITLTVTSARNITPDGVKLGVVGEHNANTIRLILPAIVGDDIAVADYNLRLEFELNDGTKLYTAALTAVDGVYDYLVDASVVAQAGSVKVTVVVYDGSTDPIWKSFECVGLTVGVAVNAVTPTPEYAGITLDEVEAVRDATIAAAGEAAESAEDAAGSAGTASAALNELTGVVPTHNASGTAHGDIREDVSDISAQFMSTALKESALLGEELLSGNGWTSDGWTGSLATGFTHTAGNTSVLSFNLGATGTNMYQVEFDVSVAIDGSKELQVRVGNSVEFDLYGHPGLHVSCGIKSTADGLLEFVPTTSFAKTITNITCKQISAARQATLTIKTADGAESIGIYPTISSLKNIFIGINSGRYNTKGYGNVGLGADSLTQNTTGFWDVAIGYQSLMRNTVGSRNVAIGFTALAYNISGMRNQAIGSFALQNNTIGYQNIAIGSDCMNDNTSGRDNVAIGFQAMYHGTTSYNNVGIGTTALAAITEGNDNIAIGKSAGAMLTTGKNNVLIGSTAGDNITTGQNNICIGNGVDAPSATGTNSLNIANTIYGNTGTGKQIGIGVASPTAHMHLKAAEATAGRASLKIDAGVLLGTPEAGAIEFDGTNLYFTNSVGERKTIAVVA